MPVWPTVYPLLVPTVQQRRVNLASWRISFSREAASQLHGATVLSGFVLEQTRVLCWGAFAAQH
jgi:hypothetical protein